MNKLPFSPKTVIILAASAVVLFALSVLLHAYESPYINLRGRAGPGAHSVSAIGYAGFYEMLKRLDRQVGRAAGDTLEGLGDDGVLVIAEPDLSIIGGKEIKKLLHPPNLLLVLPKWDGKRDPARSAWVSKVELLPYAPVLATAGLVDAAAQAHRSAWPVHWPVNSLGVDPSGTNVVQLVKSEKLEPLVGTANAMLLGEMWTDDGSRVVVLSDPDVMANHGLGKGNNAEFMLALVNRMTYEDPDVPIVFDESVHGFEERGDSPLKMLFEFPFVVATVLACCAAVVIVLAGMGRFGPPARARPDLGFGKERLIDNSARLMHHAGHHAEVLRRYVRMTVRATARSLHAPKELDPKGQAEWLDRLGRTKKLDASCVEIMRRAVGVRNDEAGFARLMQCAEDIHRWREMILARPGRPGAGDKKGGE